MSDTELSKRDEAIYIVGVIALRELQQSPWPETARPSLQAMHDLISCQLRGDELGLIRVATGYSFVVSDDYILRLSHNEAPDKPPPAFKARPRLEDGPQNVRRLSRRDQALYIVGYALLWELSGLHTPLFKEAMLTTHDHISGVVSSDEFIAIAEGTGFTFFPSDSWPPHIRPGEAPAFED